MGAPGPGDPRGSTTGAARGVVAPEAFLGAVLDASSDAVFAIDLAGAVRSWNRSAERLFGCPDDEVVGSPAAGMFPVEVGPTIAWLLGIVRSGDRIEHFETHVERRPGMVTPIALTLAPVRDAEGAIVAVAAVAHDLTEQRLAQATLAETEARLREGEALAHVGRWVWDTASGTVQWSDELHRIHGVDPWEFGGDLPAHLALVVPRDRRRVLQALQRAAAQGRPFEEEYDIVRPDEAVRHLYSRGEPTMGGTGVVALRGIIRDTSG